MSHCHLRYLNPFPRNLGKILTNFDKILVPELNLGQLSMIIRAEFMIHAIGLNKVKGKPFSVAEILNKIEELTG